MLPPLSSSLHKMITFPLVQKSGESHGQKSIYRSCKAKAVHHLQKLRRSIHQCHSCIWASGESLPVLQMVSNGVDPNNDTSTVLKAAQDDHLSIGPKIKWIPWSEVNISLVQGQSCASFTKHRRNIHQCHSRTWASGESLPVLQMVSNGVVNRICYHLLHVMALLYLSSTHGKRTLECEFKLY